MDERHYPHRIHTFRNSRKSVWLSLVTRKGRSSPWSHLTRRVRQIRQPFRLLVIGFFPGGTAPLGALLELADATMGLIFSAMFIRY